MRARSPRTKGHRLGCPCDRKPSGIKKLLREIRVAGDDQRRLEELWRGAVESIDQHQPQGLAIEGYAPIRGRAGGNAWKTAVVYGMLHGLGLSRELAVFTFLPSDLKREFAGKQSASKQDVGQSVAVKVNDLDALIEKWPKTKREHITDAAGHAYLGIMEMLRIRAMMGLSRGG